MATSLALLLEHYVCESGALVLSVWLLGVMGKPLCLVVTIELLSAPKACCCDTGLNWFVRHSWVFPGLFFFFFPLDWMFLFTMIRKWLYLRLHGICFCPCVTDIKFLRPASKVSAKTQKCIFSWNDTSFTSIIILSRVAKSWILTKLFSTFTIEQERPRCYFFYLCFGHFFVSRFISIVYLLCLKSIRLYNTRLHNEIIVVALFCY